MENIKTEEDSFKNVNISDEEICYDRMGNQIPIELWMMLIQIPYYRSVKQDTENNYLISTVFSKYWSKSLKTPPAIFETMVFKIDEQGNVNWDDIYSNHYFTQQEALEGHKKAVEMARNGNITNL